MSISVEIRGLVERIREALISSLAIEEAVAEAFPLLLRAVRADHAALGITRPGAPEDFDWLVADMPPGFFAAYPEMASHDFVLRSVLAAPNRVLRDSEMLSRRDLERNLLYRTARDLGVPLEHVMSTMLHADGAWSSGISFYRRRREPFTDADREVLELVASTLKHAVRNCRLFAETSRRARLLESLVERDGLAAILFATDGRELARSPAVTGLLERWFRAVERGPGGLPSSLCDEVRRWVSAVPTEVEPASLTRRHGGATLTLSPYWVADGFERCIVVTLREESSAATVPVEWRSRLTPREQEVAGGLLRGWDNRLIAEELGCAEGTVKKHLTHVFDKLGADQRAQLLARAGRSAR